MRFPHSDFLPSLLVAAGLSCAVAVFVFETHSFRDAVFSWARRDLEARTELAASTLRDAVATGDFKTIHGFGGKCSDEGVRLTVLSAPGGIVFDSLEGGDASDDFVFATRPCGEFSVRLGLPVSRVLAPYRRAGFGFLLAGIVGGAGVLLVLFFTFRQRARVRELARERDVQRRLLDEMKKIESFRRDFIADVSHEIKTPLAGIIGIADLLTSPGNLPQESKDSLLPMLKKESERLNRLVQGILALARIERDTQSGALDFHPVDFSETVRDAIDGLSAQMAKKGISVESSLPDSCVVEGDAQLLFSAVTNLLVNAITHSGTRDLVISLSKRDGNVSLIVEDHGVGIAQDQRERVFDRFYRVDRARGTDTGGTGLGLAIVRSIARLHGGDALLDESESPGCRFVFSINPTGARSVV